MSEPAKRPAPKENAFVDARPFWEGARAGKLVLQYCRDSGKFQHYPRPVSNRTTAEATSGDSADSEKRGRRAT